MQVHMRRMTAAMTVAAALFAFDPAGGRAAEDDVILLGAAVSQSGKYATNGMHTKNGYDLAVERINALGGVAVGDRRYRLEIRYYDDESEATRGAELVERLIAQDGVRFVLGPFSSPLTAAIAPVVEKHRVPMVEGNGASRSLFVKGYRYLFAVLATSDFYLSSAVQLAAETARAEGRDPANLRLALAMGDDNFSQDVRAGILEAAAPLGMRIVLDDKLPDAFTDMAATLTKVKALQPDLLLISGHEVGALTAARQIVEQRVDVPMLAMTHCDAADIIGQVGPAVEYTLCASQWAPSLTYGDRWFGSAGDYATAFEERFGYAAPYVAAQSSAALLTFADAFERAGTLDTEAVRDAIAATRMETFFGPIDFDETGRNPAKTMVLLQILDGEYKVIAPTGWATDKLVFPRPTWRERGS